MKAIRCIEIFSNQVCDKGDRNILSFEVGSHGNSGAVNVLMAPGL